MAIAICTLFEGNYHHGVGALSNSLYRNGYRGVIYAGFRGKLPVWAKNAKSFDVLYHSFESIKIFSPIEGIDIYFIELKIESHFAHYKPDFMLELMSGLGKDCNGIVYFDPDIVVKCKWNFFENWLENGIAIIQEITGNIMPVNHPTRFLWSKVIAAAGENVINKVSNYYNCGFCGILNKDKEFLLLWSKFIQIAIDKFGQNPFEFINNDRTSTFWSIDQDTFNMAVMSTKNRVSDMGPEAMDFLHGGFTLSHAVGNPKPWEKNFILHSVNGVAPSLADKGFWQYEGYPIGSFGIRRKKYTLITIKIASFIGRFYRKL